MTNESQVIPDPAIEGKPQAVPIKNEAKGITFEEVKKYITQKTSPFLDKLAELIQIDPITLSEEQTEIETLERKLFALDAKVSQEENVSPKEDVERFVTRVWEHPLVDDITRKRREEGKRAFSTVLQERGLNQANYIGIPVGGIVWLATENSDVDFIPIAKDKEAADALEAVRKKEISHRYGAGKDILSISKEGEIPCDIEIFFGDSNKPIPTAEAINEDTLSSFEKLLFTPNEYIAGEEELADTLRLALINNAYAKQQLEIGLSWGFYNYVHWKDNINIKLGENPRKREERFSDALENRAQQSHSPGAYKKKFNESLELIKPPSFSVFQQALQETNGNLSINQRFAAQGR